MKTKFFLLTKVIFQIMILVSISCCKNDSKSGLIIDYKDHENIYKVFENKSKVNSDNIDQCEKFLEYKENSSGFVINGADIADLYSIFFNIERNTINLKDKKAIFYSIIYDGKINNQIKKKIFENIIDVRSLKVIKSFYKKEMLILSVKNSKKINLYANPNNFEEGNVHLINNRYELENVNFLIFAKILNELYPNSFIYEEDTHNKYNLEIPIGKPKHYIIDYMKNNYDIDVINVEKEIELFEIVDR